MNLSASAFADLGQSLQPVAPDAGVGQARSLLVFHLGKRAYGLAVEDVIQIIAMIKLTPVPQVEQIIEGVANIRGKIVPVLSARRHLGLPPVDPQLYTPIILLQAGERTLGLIVDEVADVISFPDGQMTGPEAILPPGVEDAGVLEGVVHQDDMVIMVINPRCLMNPNQVRAFQRAVRSLPEAEPQDANEEVRPPKPSRSRDGGSPSAAVSTPASAPSPAPAKVKKQPSSDGHGRSRRGRRNFDEKLAGEIAGLAVDLPPSEGESPDGAPFNPGDFPPPDSVDKA
jgi:purine-binding chemotaxis protein CheW